MHLKLKPASVITSKKLYPFVCPLVTSSELENIGQFQLIDMSRYDITASAMNDISEPSFTQGHLLEFSSISGPSAIQMTSAVNLQNDNMGFLISGIPKPSKERGDIQQQPIIKQLKTGSSFTTTSNMVPSTSSSSMSSHQHQHAMLVDNSTKRSIVEHIDQHQHSHRMASAILHWQQHIASASAMASDI